MFASCQNSTQKDGRIHRGNFGVKHALPGFGVGEVVEKSAVVGQLSPQKAQRGEDAFQRSSRRNESPLVPNAQSGETEAGRGNAGRNSLTVLVNVTAVFDHPRFRVALFPEEKTTGFLHVVQKLIVLDR